MPFTLAPYSPALAPQWDSFVKESRNGTFLLQRGYMDYHADRFTDCSWVARKGEKIVALLPANITPDGILHSHQGITYGGWILPKAHINGADLLEIFTIACERWREMGIRELDYKPVPSIYPAQPSEEDIYALYRLGAQTSNVNISEAITLSDPLPANKLRRRILNAASRLPFSIEETDNADRFMAIVEGCLSERHHAHPVHTAAELAILRSRFPANIRLFILSTPAGAESSDSSDPLVPAAAVCVYDTGRVAHTQYIATTPLGRELNLLTPLLHHLITRVFPDRAYFDFGTSNQTTGPHLNEGLLRQKSSFGASAVAYPRYRLPLL